MGSCVSLATKESPCQCSKCGQEGPTAWEHLSSAERKLWLQSLQGVLRCRRCAVHEQREAHRFKAERRRYSRAKEILYPRPSRPSKLPQIPSEHSLRAGDAFLAPGRPETLKLAERLREALASEAKASPAAVGVKASGWAQEERGTLQSLQEALGREQAMAEDRGGSTAASHRARANASSQEARQRSLDRDGARTCDVAGVQPCSRDCGGQRMERLPSSSSSSSEVGSGGGGDSLGRRSPQSVVPGWAGGYLNAALIYSGGKKSRVAGGEARGPPQALGRASSALRRLQQQPSQVQLRRNSSWS